MQDNPIRCIILMSIHLKHISSPLLEFERKKLIEEYKTDPPKPSGEDGAEAAAPPPANGEEEPVFIDYM